MSRYKKFFFGRVSLRWFSKTVNWNGPKYQRSELLILFIWSFKAALLLDILVGLVTTGTKLCRNERFTFEQLWWCKGFELRSSWIHKIDLSSFSSFLRKIFSYCLGWLYWLLTRLFFFSFLLLTSRIFCLLFPRRWFCH